MKSISYIVFALSLLAITGCANDEEPKLPSVEERVSVAVEDLRSKLVDPQNGWRLDYRPNNQTGAFLILMDFNEDGTVRVQSDVTANNGAFIDQVISYRIDSSQGIELIFETYGVFHYLFELQAASFGGEFEFVLKEEEGDDLIFESKTDPSNDVTELTFTQASSSASNLISTNATVTLSQGLFQSEDLGGIGNFGSFNFHLQDQDYLLSAVFDLQSRVVKFLGIAEGANMAEVVANDNTTAINSQTTFSLSNEQVILDQPVSISFNGNSFEITELPIGEASIFTTSFCTGQDVTATRFSAADSDVGAFEANSSLFQVENDFKVAPNDLYSINHVFLFNENDSSIADQIEAVFPDVVAFQWYHGLQIADSVFNGVGFVIVDEFNNAEFLLRGFDFTQNGNLVQLTFNGNDLITLDNPTQEQLDGLDQLTDQIFTGGEVYVLELLNINGLFEFYNPCNNYKGFLF